MADYQVVVSSGSGNAVKILCSISTRGRYEYYLPMALMSVVLQTRKPDHLTIYDDNDEPKDMRKIDAYVHILQLMNLRGISWDVAFGSRRGQHHNHQHANMREFDAVWRLDDDCVAEPDVLEKLEAQMVDGVGAVGGSILTPMVNIVGAPSSSIDDLDKPNKQWVRVTKTEEVDHLHCSFLYRPRIVNYDLRLSRKAHREETMFTYALKLKGQKNLITPCVTWHLRAPEGGIRSDGDIQDFYRDEHTFRSWLDFKKHGKKLYVLNNGLGDHYMFLQAVTPEPGSVIACCFPELFKGMDCQTISIADAWMIVNVDHYNVYGWCAANHWKGTMVEAFREFYRT